MTDNKQQVLNNQSIKKKKNKIEWITDILVYYLVITFGQNSAQVDQ